MCRKKRSRQQSGQSCIRLYVHRLFATYNTMVKSKVWTLKTQFDGKVQTSNFELVEEDISDNLKDGEFLIEALYWSVDPYMRTPEFAFVKPGQGMIGEQIARMIDSKSSSHPVGSIVRAFVGWRTHTLLSDDLENQMERHFPMLFRKPELGDLRLSLILGAMGCSGMTAYFGLLEICQPKEGDVVLVNCAAGAVGSLVGQIAKIKLGVSHLCLQLESPIFVYSWECPIFVYSWSRPSLSTVGVSHLCLQLGVSHLCLQLGIAQPYLHLGVSRVCLQFGGNLTWQLSAFELTRKVYSSSYQCTLKFTLMIWRRHRCGLPLTSFHKGCKVVGCAGTDDKCKWLKELDFDEVFNYKKVDLSEALKAAAPDGFDCFFDNVGADFTATALKHMKQFGRVSICGQISSYNDKTPPKGEYPFMLILGKQLKIEGFLTTRWYPRFAEGEKAMAQWIKEGKIQCKETIYEGFENMPEAFVGLFDGANIGKVIISAKVMFNRPELP